MFAKDRMGFMPALYLAFIEELKPEEKKKFASFETQEECADMVLNHPFVKSKFDMIKLRDGKDNGKSTKAREEGNNFFQEGNFKAASNKYSTAVAFADENSEEYSLALANRSAALQRLKQPKRGIIDVDLAIKAGYPSEKMYKLLERKAQMLQEEKQYDDARDTFQMAQKLVKNSTLAPSKQEKFVSDMEKNILKIKSKENEKISEQTKQPIDDMCKINSVNPLYTSLHSSVKVKYTKEQGRYTIAKELIPAGTVILSENPLGWALEVEKTGTHCQHCLMQISVIIPCPKCTSVAFCCVECREEALKDYHANECGLMGVLAASALNNFCFMAVRSIARYSVDKIISLKSDLKKPNIEHGKTEENMKMYESSDIRNGLNLVHHSEHLNLDERIMRTLISVFLMKCLKQTKFYESKSVLDKSVDLYIAKVIHTFINACPANTHEIHILNTPTLERWSPMAEMKAIGAGLYPTAALFNHSCDPNIVRCNINKRMISVASRDIKPGEEIFDCYGLPWYSKSQEVRQEVLSKFYKFRCCCRACNEGWVTSDLLGLYSTTELSKVVCNCGGTVQKLDSRFVCKCGKEIDQRSIDIQNIRSKVHEAGEKLYTELKWTEGCEVLREAYMRLQSRICPPTLEYFNLQISIWRSLWMIAGNKKIAKLF